MEKKSVEKKIAEKKIVVSEKVKNKPSIRRPVKKSDSNPSQEILNAEKILIDNFVSFQKVMINLSIKFDNLANQISRLLELFEISAKALAEKDFDIEKNNKENMKILEKIENVLEQNKTIARGLTLMHDRINEPQNPSSQMLEPRTLPLQRLPFKPIQKTFSIEGISEEYHRPISQEEQ